MNIAKSKDSLGIPLRSKSRLQTGKGKRSQSRLSVLGTIDQDGEYNENGNFIRYVHVLCVSFYMYLNPTYIFLAETY